MKQNLWAKMKYAFAIPDEKDQTFSDEEMLLLNKVADMVVKRQLTTPAVLFLESVRPLNFLGSQTMVFFQPIVGLLISTREMEMLSQILERRKSIPLLIELIEKKDNEGREKAPTLCVGITHPVPSRPQGRGSPKAAGHPSQEGIPGDKSPIKTVATHRP
ncbi:MAG: hypothetical protein QME51_06290 [Planctomycetota bacterium]|nr:hypothetical protein [Planctomycetota bacterium]MDI6787963.1 hypothetical protein [Planctomycetota bacterium]